MKSPLMEIQYEISINAPVYKHKNKSTLNSLSQLFSHGKERIILFFDMFLSRIKKPMMIKSSELDVICYLNENANFKLSFFKLYCRTQHFIKEKPSP